jgi:hypothetical protein
MEIMQAGRGNFINALTFPTKVNSDFSLHNQFSAEPANDDLREKIKEIMNQIHVAKDNLAAAMDNLRHSKKMVLLEKMKINHLKLFLNQLEYQQRTGQPFPHHSENVSLSKFLK